MTADQMKEFVELCKHPAIAGKLRPIQPDDQVTFKVDGKVWLSRVVKHADNWTTRVYAPLIGDIHGLYYLRKRDATIIPPIYDYQHPERGLWGMMPGDFFACDKAVDGSVSIYCKGKVFVGPSLPIALAKVVIRQAERRTP